MLRTRLWSSWQTPVLIFSLPLAMEAMILAAGLGTRLRPLTNEKPKALVEVGGVPMLERVARRLVAAGADRLVVNVHAFADRIAAFVEEKDGFGVEVVISREEERPLETGGGLLHAAPLLRLEAPFLLHNADVWTDLDLRALYAAHWHAAAGGAEPLATLAMRPAVTERTLIFDAEDRLCGYGRRGDGQEVLVCDPAGGRAEHLDFCGVQVVSPRLLALITETGVFSIINVYLRLARAGEAVCPYRIREDAVWMDIGTPERLEEARRQAAG